MQVEILRRKDRYNGAESYLEIRQDGEGQGTVGSVNLRGLPGLHRQHFQGSGGGWTPDCCGLRNEWEVKTGQAACKLTLSRNMIVRGRVGRKPERGRW